MTCMIFLPKDRKYMCFIPELEVLNRQYFLNDTKTEWKHIL